MDCGHYLHLQIKIMKSNKVFFLLLLCMFFLLWCFRVTISHYSSNPTIIDCIFIGLLGLSLFKFTLNSDNFKIFLFIYLGVWFLYIILKVFTIFISILHFTSFSFFMSEVNKFYMRITFLNTPLPFIFYWVILKVLESNKNVKK